MEAKDRIVKTTEENCHNTLEERLAEQDRISFKAGETKARREATIAMNQLVNNVAKKERQEGRREVVGWIEQNKYEVYQLGHYLILTEVEQWQAFKKSRGIEEV